MTVHFTLLAISHLSAGTPITDVPQMFARVHLRALAEAVTGVMVFDGAGFCLYLEGSRDAVLRCHELGEQEARQTDVEAIAHGNSATRRYQGFFSGYALAEGLPATEQLRLLDGPAALQRFLELAQDFDLNF